MKILDSLKHIKWKGQGFNIQGNSILILKSANLSQSFEIKKGKYKVKILGKRRVGNGKIYLEVLSDENEIFMKHEINFSNNVMNEHTFDFEINRNVGFGKIKISRDRDVYGSIEIGRLFIDWNSGETSEILTNFKFKEKNKLAKKYLKGANINLQYWNQNEKTMAFIIPYQIYGGAEVYIKNIINKFPEQYRISVLYLGDNLLQNKIERTDVLHKVFKNVSQLAAYLKTADYNFIVYYNRLEVYQELSRLKDNNEISGKLVEIYHSDFMWSGSISMIKERNNVKKIITVSKSLGQDIVGDFELLTIPVGIDLDLFKYRNNIGLKEKLGLDKYRGIVGCVSRLSKEKRIDYLISLASIMPEYGFVIVGNGPEEMRLKEKVDSLRLENVRMVGFQNNTHEYYNIFDGFLLNSVIEGTPISILESMASGVVVFSNMVGSIPDILEDQKTGIKITGELESDCKIIIENLYNREITNNARVFVENNHDVLKNNKIFIDALFSGINILIERKVEMNVLPGQYI